MRLGRSTMREPDRISPGRRALDRVGTVTAVVSLASGLGYLGMRKLGHGGNAFVEAMAVGCLILGPISIVANGAYVLSA